MRADRKYTGLPLEFWANIKLLNQRLGYTRRKSKAFPNGGFVVPSIEEVKKVFRKEGLRSSKLILNDEFTDFGNSVVEYMSYRADVLTQKVAPNLMDKFAAKELFSRLKDKYNPTCPLPFNKQKGDKKDYAYLTGIVNMLIEANKGELTCDYDPRELTAITNNQFPVRTLSRRVDGAFPSVIDPIAIWEIKEYYYTTTFGSRVADGVYETQLDGWELWETRQNTGVNILHYLIIDDYNTWWNMGKSYLCRLIDVMHMGLVTEVVFGREAILRIPALVSQWKSYMNKGGSLSLAADSNE